MTRNEAIDKAIANYLAHHGKEARKDQEDIGRTILGQAMRDIHGNELDRILVNFGFAPTWKAAQSMAGALLSDNQRV